MRVLKGWHVATIAGGAFAVVLGVNILLAVTAARTFSGVVVDDGYVASLHFNEARDAQIALGWTASLREVDGVLHVAFTDAKGRAVRPATLAVTLGRPTTTRDDATISLRETSDGYVGPAHLGPGAWRVEIHATAADGTAFRQSRSLFVRADS